MSNNTGFLLNLMRIKRDNKAKFASYMEQHYNIKIDPSTMFDIQVSSSDYFMTYESGLG